MPDVSPQPPPHLAEKRTRSEDNLSDNDHASSSTITTKRSRVVGPTLPPAPLAGRPSHSPDTEAKAESDGDDSTSEDDDDFGPALPTSTNTTKPVPTMPQAAPETAPTAQRDDWMTMAPTNGDWSSRMDPTQLKARKFNTGKSAKQPQAANNASDAWHETPEQKQARLQRELMGMKDKKARPDKVPKSAENEEDVATARRLKDYSTARGPSLYQAHQQSKDKEEDDDPSARAFDREKDIAGGLQINATQRRDMLRKATDFGSRFSSAKYL